MKFLNKKERVLDIQLTRYGKAKLANRNVFDPAYYAFYDDDVQYEVSFEQIETYLLIAYGINSLIFKN